MDVFSPSEVVSNLLVEGYSSERKRESTATSDAALKSGNEAKVSIARARHPVGEQECLRICPNHAVDEFVKSQRADVLDSRLEELFRYGFIVRLRLGHASGFLEAAATPLTDLRIKD